jgi:hypothetical protein
MKIILLNDSDKFIELNSQLLEATKKLKLQNGFRKFGLFFGLALVSVFIPVLHFVLVPVFLILAVVSFFYGYNVSYQVSNPSACSCLVCSRQMTLPVLIGSNRRLTCSACSAQFRIEG